MKNYVDETLWENEPKNKVFEEKRFENSSSNLMIDFPISSFAKEGRRPILPRKDLQTLTRKYFSRRERIGSSHDRHSWGKKNQTRRFVKKETAIHFSPTENEMMEQGFSFVERKADAIQYYREPILYSNKNKETSSVSVAEMHVGNNETNDTFEMNYSDNDYLKNISARDDELRVMLSELRNDEQRMINEMKYL